MVSKNIIVETLTVKSHVESMSMVTNEPRFGGQEEIRRVFPSQIIF